MSIDTAQKRFSMVSFGRTPGPLVFEPDGSVDADDRYMLLGLYSGITLAAPPSVAAGVVWSEQKTEMVDLSAMALSMASGGMKYQKLETINTVSSEMTHG